MTGVIETIMYANTVPFPKSPVEIRAVLLPAKNKTKSTFEKSRKDGDLCKLLLFDFCYKPSEKAKQ